MAGDLAIEKKERSLAEFLLIVCLVLILMSIFVYYFLKQDEQYTKAGFERLANLFASHVVMVHGQWLMEGKPTSLALKTLSQGNQSLNRVISINQIGWPDTNSDNACAIIWLAATELALADFTVPISAVNIQQKGETGRVCRYSLPSGEYFDYNSSNGQISAVKYK